MPEESVFSAQMVFQFLSHHARLIILFGMATLGVWATCRFAETARRYFEIFPSGSELKDIYASIILCCSFLGFFGFFVIAGLVSLRILAFLL